MTFISVVPGFKCEGEFAPKEVLIQENKRWFYTLNEQNKCRSINNVEVFDVEYFEDKSFLTYKDHIFYVTGQPLRV